MRISLPGTERSVAGALRTCCRPSLVALKWRFEPYAKSIGETSSQVTLSSHHTTTRCDDGFGAQEGQRIRGGPRRGGQGQSKEGQRVSPIHLIWSHLDTADAPSSRLAGML
jgi:hypothetical protein